MWEVTRNWVQKPETPDQQVLQNPALRLLFRVTGWFQQRFFLMIGLALGLFLLVGMLALSGGGS